VTKYDELLQEAYDRGLYVRETAQEENGTIDGALVTIRKDMSSRLKAAALAEEIEHDKLTVGDIMDVSEESNARQEHKAKASTYNRLIGLDGIVKAYEHGCMSLHDAADFLDVSERILREAVIYYGHKYGQYVKHNGCIIMFIPYLAVMKRY